jgi:tetratricopeptide (TPR) repeat protein
MSPGYHLFLQPSQARPVQPQPPVQQQAQPQANQAQPTAPRLPMSRSRACVTRTISKPDVDLELQHSDQETEELAALTYRGCMVKNDLDRAVADYSQAIAIDPTESDYLNSRAAIYEHKNDMQRAMADYDQAIKLNPRSAYAYNNRGASFQRKGDFARASADYGEVTKLQPKNIDAWAACWMNPRS